MEMARRCLTFVPILIMALNARGQTDEQVALPMGSAFYTDNQTYIDGSLYVWPTATPASQGLNASVLASGSAALGRDKKAASFLVIRGNRLVHESYFNGAAANKAKNLHSANKSILSTLTGIAIGEGRLTLDTKIGDVLPHPMTADKRNITARNLLTMKSGWDWTEDHTEYKLGNNPVQAIIDLRLKHSPGSVYNYSTGDAHVLGAVLATATGSSLHQYARSRLFDPLGIDVERWGRDNQGYFSGGFNFYMTPREMARFGQLILDSDNGRSAGTSLVPQAWTELATTSQTAPSYFGYMWWLDATLTGHRGYRAWGWGKQFIYVWPDLELVAVITHDTKGKVSDTDLNSFVKQYVMGAISDVRSGDFNANGRVDAADYVAWRRPGGSLGTYNKWRANFGLGNSASGASTTAQPTAAVPEPSALILIILAMSSIRAIRRNWT